MSEKTLQSLLDAWEDAQSRGEEIATTVLCAGNPELQTELARRISSLKAMDGMLADSDKPQRPLKDGGRYQATAFHAAGGLGEIYIARDTELQRDVALKRMQRHCLLSTQNRRRFELEAEITGRLEHPGIIPVYGFGLDEDNEPYYAMRFVDGKTLHDAISAFHAERKGTEAFHATEFQNLLRSFLAVCETVAYAHSRDVIHRDIKPANIMLGSFGETLLVDWGLAKPVDADEQPDDVTHSRPGGLDSTIVNGIQRTMEGSAKGSPVYMSPEQACGDIDAIGKASDIYSLGATLYFLITGKRPFQGKHIEPILDAVRNGDFATPREANAGVPRSLEAICLKAMQNDPVDRYASAKELAADIESYLADEPVSAWMEPVTVRVRRWVKRHRTVVATSIAALVVAIIGMGVLTYRERVNNQTLSKKNDRLTQQKRELQQANARETQLRLAAQEATKAERKAKEQAQDRLKQIRRINDLLSGVFADINVRRIRAAKTPLNVVLGRRLFAITKQVDGELIADAEMTAHLQMTLGNSLMGLGFYHTAVKVYKKSHATRLAALGANHRKTLHAAASIASALREAGRLAEAIELLEKTLKVARRVLGAEDEDTIIFLNNLALTCDDAQQTDKAVRLYEQVIRLSAKTHSKDDVKTHVTKNNYGCVLRQAGRITEAIRILRSVREWRSKHLGPTHHDTLSTMNNLAQAYEDAGDVPKAIELFKKTWDEAGKVMGTEHPNVISTMSNYAGALQTAGRPKEAVPIYREVVRLRIKRLGPGHRMTLVSRHNFATALWDAGEHKAAIAELKTTLVAKRRHNGPSHSSTLATMFVLGRYQCKVGEVDVAVALFDELVKRRASGFQPRRSHVTNEIIVVINLLFDAQRLRAAERHARTYFRLWKRHRPDAAETFAFGMMLGRTLWAQKKHSEAEPYLLEAFRGGMRCNPRWTMVRNVRSGSASFLVDLYTDWKKPDSAARWQRRLRRLSPAVAPRPRVRKTSKR